VKRHTEALLIVLTAILLPGSVPGLANAAEDSVTAWGSNGAGQCSVPVPNSGFVAVAGGGQHSLGIKSDGTIVAWGSNFFFQCIVPEPNTGFIAVAAGGAHSLGLRSDGSITAWGYNPYGQCDVPAPNTGFVAISAGWVHSVGLKSDGSIVAWGLNGYGQCAEPAPNTGFIAATAGGNHTLGLKSDGSIVAWGKNDDGQCEVPSPNAGFVAVAGGYRHSLGLKSDGSIVAWGYNGHGECTVPAPNSGFVAISGGEYHSLGLKSDGSIVAWGQNNEGQCDVPAPNTGFAAIGAGALHNLGLKGAPMATLCQVAEEDVDGVAVLAGRRVTVRGIALCDGDTWSKPPTSPTYREFQITDGNCCLDVFGNPSTPTVATGDSVLAVGLVANWYGKTEITTPALFVAVLNSGNSLPPPGVTTTGTLAAAGEAFESCLFTINCVSIVGGTWPTTRVDVNLIIDDGTGPAILRLDKDTDCWTIPAPTGPFTITGIGDQYDTTSPYSTGWQIKPRSPADIVSDCATGACCHPDGSCVVSRQAQCTGSWTVAGTCEPNSCPPSGIGDADVAAALGVQATPNPFASSVSLRVAGPNATAARVMIFGAGGRLVRTAWDGMLSGGVRTVTWDGRDGSGREAPPGVYLVRLASASGDAVERVVKMQ
jgi:hypothetical protein